MSLSLTDLQREQPRQVPLANWQDVLQQNLMHSIRLVQQSLVSVTLPRQSPLRLSVSTLRLIRTMY